MPHDKKGKALKVGDVVNVKCKVIHINDGSDYCNVGLQTVEPMFPTSDPSSLSLNAKQVEVYGDLDGKGKEPGKELKGENKNG